MSAVLSPLCISFIPGIQSTDDTVLYKRTAIAFADSLFVDPTSVPFETRMAWVGAGLLQPSVVASSETGG